MRIRGKWDFLCLLKFIFFTYIDPFKINLSINDYRIFNKISNYIFDILLLGLNYQLSIHFCKVTITNHERQSERIKFIFQNNIESIVYSAGVIMVSNNDVIGI